MLISLIVDVKISANKTAKIQIWHGDDPVVVADSFGLIYALDQPARDLLVSVIRQSMADNQVIIGSCSQDSKDSRKHRADITSSPTTLSTGPGGRAASAIKAGPGSDIQGSSFFTADDNGSESESQSDASYDSSSSHDIILNSH